MLRLNTDGSRDTTFGNNGVAVIDLSNGIVNGSSFIADSAWGLGLQSDDKLVISAGQVRPAAGATDSDFAMLRLDANGSRDATFATNGVFTLDIGAANASARNVAILPDGRLVGAGYMAGPSGNVPVVYRLSPRAPCSRLHTNPTDVVLPRRTVRSSKSSAPMEWCCARW